MVNALGETTLELPATRMIEVLTVLRDDKSFAFSQLIDLAGVDYLGYAKHAESDLRWFITCCRFFITTVCVSEYFVGMMFSVVRFNDKYMAGGRVV